MNGRVRPWFVVAALAAALVAGVALVVALPAAMAPAPVDLPPVFRAAAAGEAQAAFDRATAAIRSRDRAAYRAALPASGRVARRSVSELYQTLASLSWGTLAAHLEPIPGKPGRYDVLVTGSPDGVGPADRLVADRLLDLRVLGDRVVVTGDETPPAAQREYVMAFSRPVAVRGDGIVVIADRSWLPRARTMAAQGAAARARIEAVGITPQPRAVVFLYGSLRQLRAALGGGPDEDRIRFFSGPTRRYGRSASGWRDVGVLAPALAGKDSWLPSLLAHELTHVYTTRWFNETEHEPTLLLEGLAVTAEGGRSYQPLRDDLAAGAPSLPLTTALIMGSLWTGRSTEDVHLAYLEGGSLVQYVLRDWGFARLKRFVVAVADSNLTRVGLDAATRRTLGVGWDELEAGWEQFVQTLP